MSSNNRNNRINQPENSERENNTNQMNMIPLRNPTIGWILNLKKLKTKVEKVPRGDIRKYMLFD